ncbi:O-antigen ligase family protein [Aestuariimicrobium ganziense]|uniref:O-antigen ligase family protein n=1 Tax=Aestuariimicrobium ganziense TaxID=2773677 RepID=UPI0019423106|nr:O-antigen ligase family protein [Aestuariimicrobium ganziense]
MSEAVEGERGSASAWRAFAERLRPADAFLFSLFLFDRFPLMPGFPGGVPLTAFLLVVAFFRKPMYRVRGMGVLTLGLAMLLGYLALVSHLAGVDHTNRLIRIGLLCALIVTVAQGRFHLYSAVVGLMFSTLVVNILAFYAGLTPNQYPPYLTGWFGDKNVAGLWYVVLYALGLYVIRRPRNLIVWTVLMGGVLFLTGSRTSISAFVVAAVWFLMRNRLVWALRLGLAGALVYGLLYAEERLARIGVFSNRYQTDWFRSMVEAASHEKVAAAPWFGMGLTTAVATLPNGRVEFFHNSYLALRVEGGWPMTILIVGMFAFVGVGLLSPRAVVPRRVKAGEAACGAVMVCAWKLGEVFFTSAAALALGFAIWARLAVPVGEHLVRGVSDEVRQLLLRPDGSDPDWDEETAAAAPVGTGRQVPRGEP